MTNQVTKYLKYANLQMAAEAVFGIPDGSQPGTIYRGNGVAIPETFLNAGNNRSSKFTAVQSADFSKYWTVEEHISNTATGFSGTLFRCTDDNPTLGYKKGELVLSFRSTEFVDDNVRDNKATNDLEIKEFGWAFGQLADMEKWYAELKAAGKITSPVTVTGYSLGGHLAGAFNQMRVELGQGAEVAGTYTFNGAGIGEIKPKAATSLTYVVHEFQSLRDNASSLFTNTKVQALYNGLEPKIAGGVAPSTVDLDNVKALIVEASGEIEKANTKDAQEKWRQGGLLLKALERVQAVMNEEVYMASVTNKGASGDPKHPALGGIEAARLDYQLAVLNAAQSTQPYRTNPVIAGYDGYAGRNTIALPGLDHNKIFDIYGAVPPSAVANSQHHLGQETPVFIEDQPLSRGSIGPSIGLTSLKAWDLKLLVNDFSFNDFGDTHSLVLLVDSLSVQDSLARLDPDITGNTVNEIFKTATNVSAATVLGDQGKAEADVMEKVLNSLGKMLDVSGWVKLKANPDGGTWAQIDDKGSFTGRETLQKNISLLNQAIEAKGLAGKVKVEASGASLASLAREDFGALLVLAET